MFFIKKQITCPECYTPYAIKHFFKIKCPNAYCSHYSSSMDPSFQAQSVDNISHPTAYPSKPKKAKFQTHAKQTPAFFNFKTKIDYVNFKNESKTFEVDMDTARSKGLFLSVRVAPTGKRIALKKEKIKNFSSLKIPQKTELPIWQNHVIAYHEKYGTTSALYEQLKRKYKL